MRRRVHARRRHLLPTSSRAPSQRERLGALHLSPRTDMEPAHLNLIQQADGRYFVEVVQGADRICLTPPLDNASDATRILQGVQSWTQLPVGRIN